MKTITLVLLALVAIGSTGTLLAETATQTVSFDISEQPLGEALQTFGQQAGLQVVVYSEVSKGRMAPRVEGKFTVESALGKLLANSGLKYEYLNAKTVAVLPEDMGKTGQAPAPGQALRVAQAEEATATAQSAQAPASVASAESAEEAMLEEITVTATRRMERLQDVPLSITAITADEIDRRGLVNAGDYLRGIPGVNQVDSSSNQSIIIRGIETSPVNQNFASGATTATYFGETPTTNTAGLGAGTGVDLKLVDIERVEVLRGPQGTAFGNSSIGGAVRTIPVSPKLDTLDGKLAAGYSATSGNGGDNYNVQAVGNLPLITDKFAIRAAAYQYEDAGYYRNLAGSDAAFQARVVTPFAAQAFARDEDEVGSFSVLGGRVAALFQASDDLSLTLNYTSQKTEMDGFAFATSGAYEQTLLQVAPEHVVRGEEGGVLDTDIDIANAVVEYDFGWANLLATYSHTESGSRRTQQLNLANFGLPISSDSRSDHRENVGEIRLATELDGAWNFLAGLYTETLDDEVLFDFRQFASPVFGLGQQLAQWELKQKAAFGEVSWQFLPGFTFTGGLRAYDYERSIDSVSDVFTPGTVTASSTNRDESGTNARANLSYKLDNGLLYGGWSQGFRLGKPQSPLTQCDGDGDGIVNGTNITVESTGEVDSDSADNFELGGKFALLGRRLQVDAALFRMQWTDIPVQVIAGDVLTGCGFAYLTNAGEAVSQGVEVQANFRLADPLRVDIGGSYVDAHLTKDVDAQGFFADDPLPGSPRVNASLGLQYEFKIAGYEAFIRADSIYIGSFYGNILESATTKAGDYVKLDASARIAVGNLNVDLFVRNVTDEDAFTFRDAAPRGEFFGYHLRPRTIGLQLGYAF